MTNKKTGFNNTSLGFTGALKNNLARSAAILALMSAPLMESNAGPLDYVNAGINKIRQIARKAFVPQVDAGGIDNTTGKELSSAPVEVAMVNAIPLMPSVLSKAWDVAAKGVSAAMNEAYKHPAIAGAGAGAIGALALVYMGYKAGKYLGLIGANEPIPEFKESTPSINILLGNNVPNRNTPSSNNVPNRNTPSSNNVPNRNTSPKSVVDVGMKKKNVVKKNVVKKQIKNVSDNFSDNPYEKLESQLTVHTLLSDLESVVLQYQLALEEVIENGCKDSSQLGAMMEAVGYIEVGLNAICMQVEEILFATNANLGGILEELMTQQQTLKNKKDEIIVGLYNKIININEGNKGGKQKEQYYTDCMNSFKELGDVIKGLDDINTNVLDMNFPNWKLQMV